LTIKSYREALDAALPLLDIEEQSDAIVVDLMPYRMAIADDKAKTIAKKLSALRSFVKFCNEQGEKKIILRADESIKVPKTLPKPIAHKHIMEALHHASLQEQLVVLMLYTLGLRISELAGLRLSAIKEGWVRVYGKGSKERDVPLLAPIQSLIQDYLQTSAPKEFLFEKNGEKLSENSLRYIVTKVFSRVALKVTPHQLRHSYASSLLNSGAPIVDVSELLGHASMATTQIYTKLGSALKQKNYNKAHPLCKDEI